MYLSSDVCSADLCRARPSDRRHDRGDRHQSRRGHAASLAARPQSSRCRPRAAQLHDRAAPGHPSAPEGRAMTRFGYVMTTYLTVILIGGLSFIHITPRLIWNASASTPIGLYSLDRPPRLDVTDLVAVEAPEPLASFLAERGYLPRGVPLMKRRSEEHTSELQSLMRSSYAVFCLK